MGLMLKCEPILQYFHRRHFYSMETYKMPKIRRSKNGLENWKTRKCLFAKYFRFKRTIYLEDIKKEKFF